MTFAAVGAFIDEDTGTVTSFSLTPGGVGDLILIEVINYSGAGSVSATGLSSSNVTWSQMGTTFTGTTNNGDTAVLFAGKVTSTSTQTVTVSWSGATPSAHIHIAGQEFSTTTGSWALDVQGNLDSGGTNTWPSLTPVAPGELYFGFAIDSGSAVAGSTSGFTYKVTAVPNNGLAYNPNCSVSAQAPVWGDSNQVFGVMVLVRELGAAGNVQPRATIPVPRRAAARAAWGAPVRGPAFVTVAAPVQQFRAPRRYAARAFIRFTPVATTNAAAAAGPAGSVPVLMVQRTEVISRVTGRVVRR